MKQITIADVIGALCMDDYKGINNQYVDQGKVVVVERVRRIPIWSISKVPEIRTATSFWRKYGGGTESIVIDEKENVARQQYAVRRLTPLECERLQGLPDGYTLIDDKSCSDSARYKALGNGMAQPCADYVIQRIVDEVGKT